MCRHIQLTRCTPPRWRCTLVVVNVPSHPTYTLDPPRWRCTLVVVNVPSHPIYTLDHPRWRCTLVVVSVSSHPIYTLDHPRWRCTLVVVNVPSRPTYRLDPPRWRCTLVVVNVPSRPTYTLDPSPVEVHSCCSQCAVTSNLHARPLPGGGALLLLSMCRHVQLTRWTPLPWRCTLVVVNVPSHPTYTLDPPRCRCTLVVVNVPSHPTYTLDPSTVEVYSCCSQCAVTSNLHAGPLPGGGALLL